MHESYTQRRRFHYKKICCMNVSLNDKIISLTDRTSHAMRKDKPLLKHSCCPTGLHHLSFHSCYFLFLKDFVQKVNQRIDEEKVISLYYMARTMNCLYTILVKMECRSKFRKTHKLFYFYQWSREWKVEKGLKSGQWFSSFSWLPYQLSCCKDDIFEILTFLTWHAEYFLFSRLQWFDSFVSNT